jgi:internalin A
VTGTFCAKHPKGRSGKRCLSPFPRAVNAYGHFKGGSYQYTLAGGRTSTTVRCSQTSSTSLATARAPVALGAVIELRPRPATFVVLAGQEMDTMPSSDVAATNVAVEPWPGRLRWCQFRLRTLFLLVFLASIGMSWIAVDMQRSRRQWAAKARIEKLGGEVYYEPTWLGRLLHDESLVDATRVALIGQRFTDSDAACLRDMHHVRQLVFTRTQVTDAALAYVENMSRLKSLYLHNSRGVTDAGLAHVRHAKRLEILNLTGTRLTDAGLAHLCGLDQLRLLYCPPATTDAGVANLLGLRNLQDFVLDNTKVTDVSLARLPEMRRLGGVFVEGTKITDAGLAHLGKIEPLRALDVGNTAVTDSGLAHLATLRHLSILGLRHTRITDAGVKHLAGLANLQSLWLERTQVTDAGLVHLSKLKLLTSLNLTGTQVSDAGLVHLRGLTQLQSLSLKGTSVTEAGARKLQQALPSCTIHR